MHTSINGCTRKELYQKLVPHPKSFTQYQDYLSEIISIKCCNEEYDIDATEICKNKLACDHIWVLYGVKDKQTECLQVGKNVDCICPEIINAINVFSKQINFNTERRFNTKFYNDVFYRPTDKKYNKKYEFIYREMRFKYDYLVFYTLRFEKFMSEHEDEYHKIGHGDKLSYAEVRFAFDSQAIYWDECGCSNGQKILNEIINKAILETSTL